MSDPLKPNEVISLIRDYQQAPGTTDWFIPELRRRIAQIEQQILDEGTPSEETARLKSQRAIWLEVLDIPNQCLRSQQSKIDELMKSSAVGVIRDGGI